MLFRTPVVSGRGKQSPGHSLGNVSQGSRIRLTLTKLHTFGIADLHLSVPITLVLDNARYQKCALVFATAASLQIELCFLPAYSPNLNLIERLWKFVKKQSLYSKYYADFAAFKTAITDCLSQTHTTHKEALDSLLTLRFQTFEKAQPMTV